MPDRDPHAAERQAAQIERYRQQAAEAMTELDDPYAIPPHVRAQAVAACATCDADGYTPNRHVCDHQQHSSPEVRAAAREAVRVALAKGGER